MLSLPLAFLPNLMGMDGMVILILGLLIFGRRLPEVGKNLGKTIVEFKKGLNGVADGVASDQPQEEPPAPPVSAKRLSPGTRVSAGDPIRKKLPQTEEV